MTLDISQWFLLAALVILVAEIGLFHVLKKYHPSIYIELGEPTFGDSNLSKNAFKMQAFIWSLSFLSLKDYKINILAFLIMFLGIVWVLSYIFL